MDVVEPKKKSIPGARDIITQIRTLSDAIHETDTEIKATIEKINQAFAASRANSKRNQVYTQFKELGDECNALKTERRTLFTEMDAIKLQLGNLRELTGRERNGGLIRNPEEIDNKIDELNMRLISETIPAKLEREIAAEMLSLRSMKAKLGDLEDSTNKIRSLEASMKEIKNKVAELSKEIAKKNAERDVVKAELDALSASDKVKSPEIIKMENRIIALKAQKQDLLDKKAAKKEEIAVLEAEWAKFSIVLQEQQDLEEKKNKIKESIQHLKNKKAAILDEVASFDPEIFDTLHYALSSVKSTDVFYLDINLVGQLMKYGISVPSTAAELEKTREELNEKKNNSVSAFKTRSDKVNKDIAEINDKIEKEMAKLAELPPTDLDILRKGGRSKKF